MSPVDLTIISFSFGDTINTTARIEQTSLPGRIQISKETADLLAQAGKESWTSKRAEIVEAKGKGMVQTYWLTHPEAGSTSQWTKDAATPALVSPDMDSFKESSRNILPENDPKVQRLVSLCEDTFKLREHATSQRLFSSFHFQIDWNVECLLRLVKQIVAKRNACSQTSSSHNYSSTGPSDNKLQKGETFLDEVKEIIELPQFDAAMARDVQDIDEVVLPEEAVQELRDYVTCIASMYRDNPFHSFEHAR